MLQPAGRRISATADGCRKSKLGWTCGDMDLLSSGFLLEASGCCWGLSESLQQLLLPGADSEKGNSAGRGADSVTDVSC